MRFGAKLERNSATPRATGIAMSNAMSEIITVEKNKFGIPKRIASRFAVSHGPEYVRNPRKPPSFRSSGGNASSRRNAPIAEMMSVIKTEEDVDTPSKTRSPARRRGRAST